MAIMKRFQNWLESARVNLFERGDLFALIVTCVLLLMPAFALKTASWPIEMRTIVPVAIISVVFGYLMARTRYDELFALIVSALYGMVLVVAIAGINEPTDPFQGVANVLLRSVTWVYDAVSGGINQDDTVFTLLVATLFWYMGYNAAWHIFRIDRVWRVLMPPATILVVNLAVYTGRESLDGFLAAFVFMALILIVRSTLDSKEWDWYTNGVRVPRTLRPQFIRTGVAIGALCLLGAWLVPQTGLQERIQSFQEFMRSDPFQELSEFWNRLFSPIEAEGPATADYFGGNSLNLSGAIKLGDQVIFYVQAPTTRRHYWRSRVFERYDAGQWSPTSVWRVTDATAPLDVITNDALMGQRREAMTQTFTMNSGSSLIYAAPQPSQISVAGRLDIVRIDETLGDLSPMNVSAIRPLRVLERGTSYTATSLLSVATVEELRSAGTNYPEWVANPNAVVGFSLSSRVVQFARDIVTNANATNPYDQAKAIETWLRQNITYNETISAPPIGADPVDWFLFELREGYCTYYATAMATMLRSLGIPARLAAGFSQGEWDASIGQYVVRERDAHTWVEVYFPGYGWVEFEPTSSEEPFDRDGEEPQPPPESDDLGEGSIPTETPTPQPSPTPIPTNTPSADRQEQDPPPPPTAFSTPTPTPTPTPVIVPTVAPPIEPPPPPRNDFLSFLLPALGTALLIILGVLAIVAVALFVWWWWEWRGMGGLSPVVRAYARLERYISLIGIKPRDGQTPEEKRRDMVEKLPSAEKPITVITRNYTAERYSPPRPEKAQDKRYAQATDRAWLDARRNILARWLSKFNPFKRDK